MWDDELLVYRGVDPEERVRVRGRLDGGLCPRLQDAVPHSCSGHGPAPEQFLLTTDKWLGLDTERGRSRQDAAGMETQNAKSVVIIAAAMETCRAGLARAGHLPSDRG